MNIFDKNPLPLIIAEDKEVLTNSVIEVLRREGFAIVEVEEDQFPF